MQINVTWTSWLVGGFNHLEKYEFVNGKHYPIYIMETNETTSQINHDAKKTYLTNKRSQTIPSGEWSVFVFFGRLQEHDFQIFPADWIPSGNLT